MTDVAGAKHSNGNAKVPRGYVPVDIVAQDRNGAKLLAGLEQAGLIKGGASYGAMVSGYAPAHKLGTISHMHGVTSASIAQSSKSPTVVQGVLDQATVHPGLVSSTAVGGAGQTQVHPGVVNPVAVPSGQTTVHPGLVSAGSSTNAVFDVEQTVVHTGIVKPSTAASGDAVPGSAADVHDPVAPTVVTTGGNGDTLEAVDIVASKGGSGADLLSYLKSKNMIKDGASWGSMASGYVKASDLATIGQDSKVASATISPSATFAGRVDNEADPALMADVARANSGVDGSGVKVGILSDSFNTSMTAKDPTGATDSQATDIASGDLPADTMVINDYNPTAGQPAATDEGRGMAQIVHDVAPGAAIRFETANGGQAVFAQHILDLANQGCKVIVDDVGYFTELSYQDGPVAQAINQVKAMGVTYLSSAGNNGTNGYESAFHAGTAFAYNNVNYTHDLFGGQNGLAFTAGAEQTVTLQWAQPGAAAGGKGSASDLDLFVTDAAGHVLNPTGQGVAANIGGDPVEVVQPTLTQGQTYYVQVGLKSGSVAPSDLRINIQDDGAGAKIAPVSDNTNTGTFYGHAAATGAIGVAAAPFTQTPKYGTTPAKAETFSSPGPDNVYYDTAGNPLATPDARQVGLTGVDGGETTFFGFGKGPNGYPQFFGTSAAAPSVAGVAALMLQKNPSLTPDQVTSILKTTATPAVDSAGNTDQPATGAGLVNAAAALAATPAVCFAQGTRIRLADGADVAVEDLAVGDMVETATGGARPIRWLGHRTLRPAEHAMPSTVWPVRVSAGAFGHGLPERDLMLSPGHPVLVGADEDNAGGYLVPVMCLINGTSIRKIEASSVTYWHVELDAHDVLLAEGLPAESYLDWGDRGFFTEGSDHALANPDFVVPGLEGRCRPVAVDGPVVETERRRLDMAFARRLTAACAWPGTEDGPALERWHH